VANAVAGAINLVILKPLPSKTAVPLVGGNRGFGAELKEIGGGLDKPMFGGSGSLTCVGTGRYRQ